ncbi:MULTISPECIES: radical SAM family heme chaperone HemW [Campylobacter]|uniref:radical SAM family heme chaperone HemW n=1 Tax=Campylobacter TaxID=194 RepID=UPI000A3504D0|nr:radical SAM family heme chaperone HemW [Campylobacter sp. P0024]MCR8678368.1 radical SAM family heme chaperone HemW [Campylobacter sp. RM19072]
MHIYIHIPFCESKCPYCAFGSHSDQFAITKEYFKALTKEIKNIKFNDKISTIFIGGGTPSSVDARLYDEIFEYLRPNLNKDCEITSEANPNSANLKWLNHMRELGVNRLSLGAQSFNEKKLKFLGRIHNSKRIFKAVEDAKIAGFKNINVDIMYGTKLDTKALISSEIQALKELEITHISAYSLMLESEFSSKISYQKDSPILAKYLINSLENIGFNQYEISNFGQICKHNLDYWQGDDYYGFGAYAVGTIGLKRYKGATNLKNYIANPFKKSIEKLSLEDKRSERVFLGLRSIIGVSLSDLSSNMQKTAEILIKERKLILKNGRIYNPNFLLADEIYLYLSQP